MQIIILIYKLVLERKFSSDSKNKHNETPSILINNPKVFGNLDQIDYAIFDKTGTLTEKNFILDSLYFKNKNFLIEFHENNKIISETNLNKHKNNDEQNKDSLFFIQEDPENFIPTVRKSNPSSQNQNKSFIKKGKSYDIPSNTNQATLLRKEKSSPNNEFYLNDMIEEQEGDKYFDSDNFSNLQNFTNKDDFQKHSHKYSKELNKVYKCLSLTHPRGLMQNRFQDKNHNHNEIYSYEDEIIQSFCRENGLGLLKCSLDQFSGDSSRTLYYLAEKTENNKTKEIKYNVVGINEYSNKRKRFSIVLEDFQNDEFILFCKGRYEAIIDRIHMNPDQKITFNKIIREYLEKGLRIVVYTQRKLEYSESRGYYEKYNNLKTSIISQTNELEILSDGIEHNLELVCIVGLKEQPRAEAMKFIKQIQTDYFKPKIFILTGDGYTNACNIGTQFSLYDHSQIRNSIHFKGTNSENLRYFLREILSDMKLNIWDKYQKDEPLENSVLEHIQTINNESNSKKNQEPEYRKYRVSNEKKILKELNKEIAGYFASKIIFIEGDTMSILLKDQYLYLNFAFILAYSQKLIGYNFTAENKDEMINLIKTKFPHSPTILTIGDGYNDALMMKSSDISVEICENFEKSLHIADITVKNFGVLGELLHNYGQKCNKILIFCIFMRFFQSSLFAFCLFFSNCLFHGKFYVNYENVFYFVIVSTIDILFISLYPFQKNTQYLQKNISAFNLEKNHKINFLKFILQVVFAGISGCLIYLVTISYLMSFVDQNGVPIYAAMTNSMIFSVLIISSQEKLFYFYFDQKFGIILMIFHFLLLIGGLIVYFILTLEEEIILFILKNSFLIILSLVEVFAFKYIFFLVVERAFSHANKVFLRKNNRKFFDDESYK